VLITGHFQREQYADSLTG